MCKEIKVEELSQPPQKYINTALYKLSCVACMIGSDTSVGKFLCKKVQTRAMKCSISPMCGDCTPVGV